MLYVICLFILTIAPAIFLAAYIYKKDVYEKESTKLLTRLFFAGILSAMLTIIISSILGGIFPFFASDSTNVLYYSLPELFIYVFVGIAFVEEFSKWIFVKMIAWNNKEFNYLYDAIVYSVFVSLGFATIENILYALEVSTLKNVLLRAVLAVPGHAFDGVFMGYNLAKAKLFKLQKDKKNSRKYLIFSLLVPTLLHGIYDFLLFADESNHFFLWLFIFFILILYIMAFLYIKKVSKDATYFFNQDDKEISQKEYIHINCPYCHHLIHRNSIFCSQCGRKIK